MGRPAKPYRTSWGEYVNGLRRHTVAKRWIISATGETYTEPDERRAVARFRRWERDQEKATVRLSIGEVPRVGVRQDGTRGPLAIRELAASPLAAVATVRLPMGGTADRSLPVPRSYAVAADVPEAELWAWMREQLIARPEHAAQMVGIPEVARLADLPAPKPSPTLAEVGSLYASKPDLSEPERKKAVARWNEFADAVGVETLRQVTVEAVNRYGDAVLAEVRGGKSPTYARHRFGVVKTVLHHARKRGMNPADVRHALDCCAVLCKPKASAPHPKPITREHFAALLAAADVEMQAALLLSLNLCLYPSEVAALEWEFIDLERRVVVTDRRKTGVIRVGVLWERTIDALTKLEGRTGPLFKSDRINRLSDATMRRRFWRLRQVATIPHDVQWQHIRDGAYTAAAETPGVELAHVRALAGHSSGISDHYLARHPRAVAAACAGIEAAYFG